MPLPPASSEDDDSDSEPSVDNFDLQELEEHLGAALDPTEVEENPFLRPIVEIVEENHTKVLRDQQPLPQTVSDHEIPPQEVVLSKPTVQDDFEHSVEPAMASSLNSHESKFRENDREFAL